MSLILCFSTKSEKESGEGKKRWAKAVQKIAIQHQQESALAYIGEDRLQKLTCPSVCVTTHDVDKVSNLVFVIIKIIKSQVEAKHFSPINPY